LTEPFSQYEILPSLLERKMQPQPFNNDEMSPLSGRLVGARGANAAQRAARAVHLASVPQAQNPDAGLGQVAETPMARRPDAPANDHSPVARPAEGAAPRSLPKKALAGLAAAIVLAAGGWYADYWLTVGRFIVSTDDAYVHADATTLAAKVAGYVSAIDVADNTQVHAGEVIARIDDGDYRLALDTARDKVATQQATVARIGKQIEAQRASVGQAKAQLASAQAAAIRTESELKRQQDLEAREFASRQTLEQAQANRDQAAAGVQSAQAALDSATVGVEVLAAQRQEATRQLQELNTALAKAERDLSFTVIRAPIDGAIGNRAMQLGDYVQTGQRLASLVPLTEVYIDANFKETQLARLRPGQPVSISVDALGDSDITGTVQSVSPASGSVFSLLPPDNATGNFTKIVQRLAVRIRLPADVAEQRLLRPGMSVVASVNTKPGATVADTAKTWSVAGDVPHWQAASQ
jgi:membrane fusion protein, multidrug efflux system